MDLLGVRHVHEHAEPADKDERYLVYVQAGEPIRFSRIKRKWPEISAWEETRLIRAQLAKN